MILTALVLLIWFNNSVNVLSYKVDVVDFGIYHQALLELSQFEYLNPYITVRDVLIFNDHFDPVILLIAPLTRFFNYSPVFSYFIEISFVLGTMFMMTKDKWPYKNELFLSLLLLVFSRGVVSGLYYGIHPTTWSMLPMYFVFKSMKLENTFLILVSFFALFLFKEIFPIIGLSTGLAYLVLKKWKIGFALSSLSLFFLCMIFIVRPSMSVGTIDYSQLDYLKNSYHFPWKDFLKMLIPVIIPGYFILKENRRNLFLYIAFYLPLLGMHIVSGKGYYHYGVVIAFPLILWVHFYLKETSFWHNRKRVGISFLIVFLIGLGSHQKSFKKIFSHNYEFPVTSVDVHACQGTILSTPGLITRLLRPGVKFYELNSFSKHLRQYDCLLLPNNLTTLAFRYDVSLLKKGCVDTNTKVIHKDQTLTFYRGPFKQKCLESLIQ